MIEIENDERGEDTHKRKLIVAYLAYALEDVRALSENGSHLLQMAITTISEETLRKGPEPEANIASCH